MTLARYPVHWHICFLYESLDLMATCATADIQLCLQDKKTPAVHLLKVISLKRMTSRLTIMLIYINMYIFQNQSGDMREAPQPISQPYFYTCIYMLR